MSLPELQQLAEEGDRKRREAILPSTPPTAARDASFAGQLPFPTSFVKWFSPPVTEREWDFAGPGGRPHVLRVIFSRPLAPDENTLLFRAICSIHPRIMMSSDPNPVFIEPIVDHSWLGWVRSILEIVLRLFHAVVPIDSVDIVGS